MSVCLNVELCRTILRFDILMNFFLSFKMRLKKYEVLEYTDEEMGV